MAYMHPAALEARRKYLTRHDAWRFAPPGTPEAQMPGWLDPSMTRVRWKEAQEAEARAQAAAAQEEFERKLAQLRASHERVKQELAEINYEFAWRSILRKFRPDQPRVPAGNPDGGQWTSGNEGTGSDGGDTASEGESLAQDRRSFVAPGPGQEPRGDLVDLNAIANHPPIRAQIDEAWSASDPNGFGREHGFWISRNDATGEIFTRPFANPGGAATIVPGRPPSDAIASFHTHPARPDFGGYPGPSLEDVRYAEWVGLPGLLQSHNGMYYFGPLLRPRPSR